MNDLCCHSSTSILYFLFDLLFQSLVFKSKQRKTCVLKLHAHAKFETTHSSKSGCVKKGSLLLPDHTILHTRLFSVLVCPSVLTMSFPALCADSARPPGMLTCHAILLSLLKKSGKVCVTLFPRFPPPWPAPLLCQVFDAIKIATSLVVCFLQRQFNHR
jgi:hypothetical protein